MPNTIIHLLSNLLLIGIIFFIFKYVIKKKFNYQLPLLLMISSNVIDIDHLLATPIYDSLRCSINFHPLHSWYTFPLYFIGVFFKKFRFLFIGIIMHLILDYIDCLI